MAKWLKSDTLVAFTRRCCCRRFASNLTACVRVCAVKRQYVATVKIISRQVIDNGIQEVDSNTGRHTLRHKILLINYSFIACSGYIEENTENLYELQNRLASSEHPLGGCKWKT